MMVNQFRLFCDYNKLMNQRIFEAASNLSISELNEDKKAFFKSVLGTLNHILVGDIIWLKRFSSSLPNNQVLAYIASLSSPKSLDSFMFSDFSILKSEREKIDSIICSWIYELSEDDLNKIITYKNMAGKEFKKPYFSLINHLFFHQVHHRGQASVLLSQFGLDFGDTDLIEIIQDN